eukprot:1191614-Prorocentrum_minimum.AAC.2
MAGAPWVPLGPRLVLTLGIFWLPSCDWFSGAARAGDLPHGGGGHPCDGGEPAGGADPTQPARVQQHPDGVLAQRRAYPAPGQGGRDERPPAE